MLLPLPAPQWTRRHATHLLNRSSFGGTPEQRESLFLLGQSQGIEAAVDSLLPGSVDWEGLFPSPAIPPDDYSNEWLFGRRAELAGWFSTQMVEAPGAAGKTFKFWIDHFPVDDLMIQREQLFPYLYKHLKILRTHSLGDFPALTKAVSWSAAMSRMLDLHRSKRDKINENFGRELMELFTLGVDGGYTETDVTVCARAFTGRRLSGSPLYDSFLDETVFTAGTNSGEYEFIDPTEKVFLGTTLAAIKKPADQQPGDPKEHGDAVIDVIMGRPQTAAHMAWKLWRYFVAPDPSPTVVADLGVTFKDVHGYNVRELLKTIFTSEGFYADGVMGDQIKDPVDLVVSATKPLQRPVPAPDTSHRILSRIGWNVQRPPSVEGWPEPERSGNQWLAAGSMVSRINLSSFFSHANEKSIPNWASIPATELPVPPLDLDTLIPRSVRGRKNRKILVDYLADLLIPHQPLDSEERRALLRIATRPPFWMREDDIHRELIRQILATPQFQMQ